MHVDPSYTDAFNALVLGEKWWVAMPNDIYEFPDEFTCSKSCTEGVTNYHHTVGLWFSHILPQIRCGLNF